MAKRHVLGLKIIYIVINNAFYDTLEIFVINHNCNIEKVFLTKTTLPVRSLGGFGKIDLMISRIESIIDISVPIINSANK